MVAIGVTWPHRRLYIVCAQSQLQTYKRSKQVIGAVSAVAARHGCVDILDYKQTIAGMRIKSIADVCMFVRL